MKPRLFVASSKESLNFAYAIQEELEYDAEVTLWSQDIFTASQNNLKSIISSAYEFDFGIFIFSPDDITIINGNNMKSARDNIIFEIGVYMAMLGPERCFFIIPRERSDFRIPTDLLGIEPLTFDTSRSDNNYRASFGPSCNRIRKVILKLGFIKDYKKSNEILTYPPKMTIKDKNEIVNGLQLIISTLGNKDLSASIVFADLDNFKAINKWFGNEVCDQIIKIVEKEFINTFQSNFVKRVSGDQFISCLVENDGNSLVELGENFCNKIANYDWYKISPNLFVTISLGYSFYNRESSIDEWIIRAIHGSMKTKKVGGNKISMGPIVLDRRNSININDYLSE